MNFFSKKAIKAMKKSSHKKTGLDSLPLTFYYDVTQNSTTAFYSISTESFGRNLGF